MGRGSIWIGRRKRPRFDDPIADFFARERVGARLALAVDRGRQDRGRQDRGKPCPYGEFQLLYGNRATCAGEAMIGKVGEDTEVDTSACDGFNVRG